MKRKRKKEMKTVYERRTPPVGRSENGNSYN